ncbi:MAG TPA: hypothetical protein VGG35_00710 [Streptosporangiaceae bacterium]
MSHAGSPGRTCGRQRQAPGSSNTELSGRRDRRDSLRRALDALIALGCARRNEGYGHPLRPEYLVTDVGRAAAQLARRVTRSPARDILLRKWSVPVLAGLEQPRRFSQLRASLPAVTPARWRWRCRTWSRPRWSAGTSCRPARRLPFTSPTRDARLVLHGGR